MNAYYYLNQDKPYERKKISTSRMSMTMFFNYEHTTSFNSDLIYSSKRKKKNTQNYTGLLS